MLLEARLAASLIHDPKCVSSSPTQTRIKFPCFYLQLTITMVIVDGANLKVLELSVIGKGLNKVKMHLGSLGSYYSSIKTSKFDALPCAYYLYCHYIAPTTQGCKPITVSNTNFHGLYNDIRAKGADSRTLVRIGFKHTAGILSLINFPLLAFFLYVNT